LVMQWSPLFVTMAVLSVVVSVACGGESTADPSPTATLAPIPTSTPTVKPEPVAVAVGEGNGLTPEMEPEPDFDLLPEASAPEGLGTVAWPNNNPEISALFARLPLEIAGHRIKAQFNQSVLGVFSTTYEEPNMGVVVHDLTKGDFFPTDTNAGQFVALYAQRGDWEVFAAGREGDLAWVQWKTGDLYAMHWGNAPSSIVFQAMANDLKLLMALVEAMVSAASG